MKLPNFKNRTLTRSTLKLLSIPAFALLTELEIKGQENLPEHGPLLVVGNHFSFIDPAAFVRMAPWEVEFVGGADNPHAPVVTRIFPRLWGYQRLYRGTGARDALRNAEQHLKEGGILGIFPEGGNWATVLRPARPGTAFLSTRTSAPLLPVGLYGFTEVFPSLSRGKRAKVTINIGESFGPFKVDTSNSRQRRKQLDEIGHEIMQQIARLLPPELQGHYSKDPAIRAAALGTEKYPWEKKIEGEVQGIIH
jgi:1-acyl-sn-glycerol-3-phosphate acyltransferase